MRDGSLAGADLATDTLGDRQIDESQLDLDRLGGVGATRTSRTWSAWNPPATNAVTPEVAPPAGAAGQTADRRRRARGGGAAGAVALSPNGPDGRPVAAAFATAATGNWQLVDVAIWLAILVGADVTTRPPGRGHEPPHSPSSSRSG